MMITYRNTSGLWAFLTGLLCCGLLGAVRGQVDGEGGGGGGSVCDRMPSDTTASKTPGDNGFRIKISGRPQPERYTPGQVYTVTVNGTYSDQRLVGFMLVAVPLNAKDESTAMGNFQHLSDGLTKSADECPYVMTHTFKHEKAAVEMLWTAPPSGAGCIEFRATVMEYDYIWYKDDGALTKVFCEDTGRTDDDHSPDMIPECCACGAAKYQMTFHGLWSHRTHPKDYPTHKRLLHWSNIVGASHSKHYMIWQYSAYASKGIKEVCEFGYPRTLEQEMRAHSQDVRTVIKTPGIWWSDPHGLEQIRWARFSVDKKNHLLSMLSMLGPSPDWCAGVSALNLCLPNCTWSGDTVIDLFPWDSGTDDGITYMSRNMKSDPQQKIHRITNTFPNNEASPFFGSDPILPLAKLEIKRIYPKVGDPMVCTGQEDLEEEEEEEESNFQENLDGLSDMERKKLMMMKGGKCAVSDWGDWSECSVTCGVGQRFRKRMYLNPMVDEDMCGQPVMESENCIGVENECESPDQECAVTSWSEWSPCSVTCGKGLQERRRYYLNPMDMKTCNRVTSEQEICMADLLDCSLAFAMKNFTAICSLPAETGPCRGRFPRFYYDVNMQKCLHFDYGGCRGNNNRFETMEECMDMCFMHMKQEMMRLALEAETPSGVSGSQRGQAAAEEEAEEKTRSGKNSRKKNKSKSKEEQETGPEEGETRQEATNCMMSDWTDWSECSSTCGKAYKYKRRMVKRPEENGGVKCPLKLEKKRKCKVPKCPRDCELGPWGGWSPCGKTCGGDSVQERTRRIMHKARRGGQPCGGRLERRYCSLPACPDDAKALSKAERTKRLRTAQLSGGL